MNRFKPCFALLLVFFLTGCATANTQTARQLDQGETLVSVAVDMPGVMYYPRAGAHLT